MNPLTATSRRERIPELDLLRGFALFGIIMVNVQFIGLPFFKALTDLHPFTDPLSQFSKGLVGILLEGKFITLFSFMFGFGFWMFTHRARERGRTAGPLFFWRIFLLALFGAAHATLFWAGDILIPYAILGLLLLIFLNRSDKTVRIWMVLFPAFQILLVVVIVVLVQWALTIPEAKEQVLASFDEAQMQMEQLTAATLQAYQSSNWTAMIPVRLQELAFVYQGYLFGGIGFFYLFGLFLAGNLAGRQGWFQNLDEKLPVIRKRAPWLLLAGLAFAIPGYILYQRADILIPDWNMAGYILLFVIGTPILSSAYAMLLILGYHRWRRVRIWEWLGSAGRMSLTIYVTQSIILTTVFYGHGLGLMMQVPVAGMLLIALATFVLQVAAAHWWMQRFTMGPLEWLWRAATYGYLPALKRRMEEAE